MTSLWLKWLTISYGENFLCRSRIKGGKTRRRRESAKYIFRLVCVRLTSEPSKTSSTKRVDLILSHSRRAQPKAANFHAARRWRNPTRKRKFPRAQVFRKIAGILGQARARMSEEQLNRTRASEGVSLDENKPQAQLPPEYERRWEAGKLKAFLDEKEMLKELPISRRTLWNWRHQGKIPAIVIGRRVLYHRHSVEQALLRLQKGAVQ